MDSKNTKSATLPKSLTSKTTLIHNNPQLKQQIRSYFLHTYSLYEQLFQIIDSEQAYYIKAEPLRHPLIFYYAHTAAIYVNKFIDHGIIRQRICPEYEKMFAVGVDQMDWDDLNATHYDWPSLLNAKTFRNQVKQMVLDVIDRSTSNHIQNWMNELWVVLLGIQHQRIHLETSAVIIRRVPLCYLKQVQIFVECNQRLLQLKNVPQNNMIEVASWVGTWQRTKEEAETYGWDNQFGIKHFNVKGFKASEMLVSNGEYLSFINQGGYQRPELWTEQGQRWIASTKPTLPLFWRHKSGRYLLRTLNKQIDMPWDWPVEISNLQARAFCSWRTTKTGVYTRLPTEDEYYAIRDQLKQDQFDWQYQSVGNINLQYWMSPNPVNMFKTGDFYDIVGNVWQHTITPIYPFQKFQIHPVYEDFTTPTFDQRHDLIKGGSFISTGNQALYHSRYAFRRHFYQFAGFRYVQSDIHIEVDLHSTEIISDTKVEMNLKSHYLNKKSYVLEVVQEIKSKLGHKPKDKKVLTVGCSVGRIPMELAKLFGESIGIDYTTRYFQMSTRLQQTGFLKFKDIDIDLKKLDLQSPNISLLQMNPMNPDQKKVSGCDWIIIDGFSLKKDSMGEVLSKVVKLANRSATFVVINVEGKNKVEKEEARRILVKGCDCEIKVGEEKRLRASDEEQSYLPDWENQLTFTLNYFWMAEG